MQEEFKSIETIHNSSAAPVPIENKDTLNNISKYQYEVHNKFNYLMQSELFERTKITNCDLKNKLTILDNNIHIVRGFITNNGFYDVEFNEINKTTEEVISENDLIELEIEKSNIYNFYDVCKHLNKPTYDYDIVNDILNLSLKLNISEYEEFQYYNLNDLTVFSNKLLNSKIYSIKKYLTDLNLYTSVLDNLSLAVIHDTSLLEDILIKIDEIMKNDHEDMTITIKNYDNLIELLLNLCNSYYIEFEINNKTLNSWDFKLKLAKIKEELKINSSVYELETEILAHEEYIEKNLLNIWEGPTSNIELIKHKFEIDEKFTSLYNNEIFSDKTLENMDELSDDDLIFLNDFKTNENNNFKSSCLSFYENYEYLMQQVDKLNELNVNDFRSLLKVFKNINEIIKLSEITDCIDLFEFRIKYNDSIKLINNFMEKLEPYSDIYNKYFNQDEFNTPIEEIIDKLNLNIKYTELINDKFIDKNIQNLSEHNFNKLLELVNKIENLNTIIQKELENNHININVDFREIKSNWNNMKDANIVISNLESLRNNFNRGYANYFDYVYYYEDDAKFTAEDLVHLFLISKNKITNLQVMEE